MSARAHKGLEAGLAAMVLVLLCAGSSLANGEVTQTQYSTSLTEATGIVRIIVAVLGGAIAVLGVFVALKNVGGRASVDLSGPGGYRINMKGVGQGVVLALIGAGVLVAALYFMPEKRSETVIKGKSITVEGSLEQPKRMEAKK